MAGVGRMRKRRVLASGGGAVVQVRCIRCGHVWLPRHPGRPNKCPRCQKPDWDGKILDGPPARPVRGKVGLVQVILTLDALGDAILELARHVANMETLLQRLVASSKHSDGQAAAPRRATQG
jgi:hypothetical protein